MANAKTAAKGAAKKTAGKKSATGTSMVAWEERLRQEAQVAAAIEENVGSGGSFISTKGGRLMFEGAEIPGNKMNVVILDHILENNLFAGRYDPDTPASPVCFSLGRDENELAPHENSPEPQHDTCRGCPMNEFGTADTGKGKACKNSRRLALITEGDLEDIENAKVSYLKLPVTSVKGWAGYVRQLHTTLGRPPFGVVTEISLVPDPKTQFKMQFKLVEQIDSAESFEALFTKKDAVAQEIAFPYQPREEEEERPARGRQAVGRRPGAQQRTVAPARQPAQARGPAKPAAAAKGGAPARGASAGGAGKGKAAPAKKAGRKY